MAIKRQNLSSKRSKKMVNSLSDILAGNLKVVFCGINPGLKSAMEGYHFSGRSNRFWKVLYLADFTPYEIQPINDQTILDFGLGLTTAVERPTSRADQLSKEEFVASSDNFRRKIRRYQPEYIAFLGKAAYATFSGKKNVEWGLQEDSFEESIAWVLPNPSGLNRGFSLQELVEAYKKMHTAIS